MLLSKLGGGRGSDCVLLNNVTTKSESMIRKGYHFDIICGILTDSWRMRGKFKH